MNALSEKTIVLPDGGALLVLPPVAVQCRRCGRAALLFINKHGHTVCALCADREETP